MGSFYDFSLQENIVSFYIVISLFISVLASKNDRDDLDFDFSNEMNEDGQPQNLNGEGSVHSDKNSLVLNKGKTKSFIERKRLSKLLLFEEGPEEKWIDFSSSIDWKEEKVEQKAHKSYQFQVNKQDPRVVVVTRIKNNDGGALKYQSLKEVLPAFPSVK